MLDNATIRRALPGQLFSRTQIPVCLWFLAKNKSADAKRGFRDRRQLTDAGHRIPDNEDRLWIANR